MIFICKVCKQEINEESIFFNGNVYHIDCWKSLKEVIEE